MYNTNLIDPTKVTLNRTSFNSWDAYYEGTLVGKVVSNPVQCDYNGCKSMIEAVQRLVDVKK